MTVEIETVFATAEAMQAEGVAPSVRKVQDRLDVGRHGYIAPYLALWTRRENDLAAVEDLPDEYVKNALQSALRVWEMAQKTAGIKEAILVQEIERLNRRFDEREDEFGAEMRAREESWEKEKAALVADRDEQARADAGMKGKVQELELKLSEMKERVERAESTKAKAEDQRDATDARYADLSSASRSEVAKLEKKVEDLLERALGAEQREAALDERLRDARRQWDHDAKRLDDLITRLVDMVPEEPVRKRRTGQASAPS
ncbi:chromosome segregation ATPase [Sagittula marina]|uniref:Chromosome segregation ATPase n=1 Tax=Sagittula marina TaxID=943940 RepID=A0A7W6GU26_9RHOB|nr:DNA-binding protein [Sagittula marina]MBB3987078.1 chromosome segregation ATPase [Sagittula marina]